MKKRNSLVVFLVIIISTVFFAGCATANPTSGDQEIAKIGNIVIRINPEISVEYDKNGLVTNVVGLNSDGSDVVSEYKDYTGEECKTVVSEIVKKANDSGYFASDVDGEYRDVIIQIEPGSLLPAEDFLSEITINVKDTIRNFGLDGSVISIGNNDYDPRYKTDKESSKYITKEKAAEIALAHAKVSKDNVIFDDREFDFNNGNPIYEFEFESGGVKYEYDIDAITGKILKSKKEDDSGDSGYNDSDYGSTTKSPTTRPPAKSSVKNDSDYDTDYDSDYDTDYDSDYDTDYDSEYD